MRFELRFHRFGPVFGTVVYKDPVVIVADGFTSMDHAQMWGFLQASVLSSHEAVPYFLANVTQADAAPGKENFICCAIPSYYMDDVEWVRP